MALAFLRTSNSPEGAMIWTPNKVTFLRVVVGFAAVSLFGHGAWLNLLAVALTVAAIFYCDFGVLSRKGRAP